MGKRSLLLVNGDARSLRVLEVSLRKAGFLITTAVNGRDALEKARTSRPDLILSDTDMPEMDGFALCRELKADPNLARVPFVFLTGETAIESKIRGLELGVDEYLTKPIYIKEILTRIRILLQKQQRARLETRRDPNTRFAGTLHDMGVVDLIQTIEVSRKSGLIHFSAADGRQATIYFRNGAVIDAETGHLQGADAVYRLLTWSEGEFELLFRTVRRKDAIDMGTQALLMEGMRRLDEWGRLLEQLPQLATRFEVDVAELAERLAELPDELNHILRLFDGRRSLIDVIDLNGGGDLECIELVSRLYFEGLLHEVEGPPVDTAPEVSTDVALEGWLGRQIPPNDRPPTLDPLPGEVAAGAEAEWDASDADAAAEMMWPSQPAVATPEAPREEAGAVVGSVSESSAPVAPDPDGRSSRSSSPADVADEGGRRAKSSSSPPVDAADATMLEHAGRRVLVPPPTVGPVPAGSVVAMESAAGDSEGLGAEPGRVVEERAGEETSQAVEGPIRPMPGVRADGGPADSLDASAPSGIPGDEEGGASFASRSANDARVVAEAKVGQAAAPGDDAGSLAAQSDEGSGRASLEPVAVENAASGDDVADRAALQSSRESSDAGAPIVRGTGADGEEAPGPAGESAEDPQEAEFGAITEPFERARRQAAERLARREADERARREAADASARRRPGERSPRRETGAGGSNGHGAGGAREGAEEFGADTERLAPDLRARVRRSGADVDPSRRLGIADDSEDAEFEAETGRFPAELRELVRRRAAGLSDEEVASAGHAVSGSAESAEDEEFEADTQRLPPELRAAARGRSGGASGLEVEGDTQQLPRDLRERVRRRTRLGLVADVVESRMSDLSSEAGRGRIKGFGRDERRRHGLFALDGGRADEGVADVDESTPVLPEAEAASFDGDFEELTPDLALHEGSLRAREFGADTEELPTPIEEAEVSSSREAVESPTPVMRLDAEVLRSTEDLPAPLGVVAETALGRGEPSGPVTRGEAALRRPREEFPGPLLEADARSLLPPGELPGREMADGSPRATGEFPGPIATDGPPPPAIDEFPGPVMTDGTRRATEEFPGPVLRIDVEVLRSTEEFPGPLLAGRPAGPQAPGVVGPEQKHAAREDLVGSPVDMDADEPPTPPSGVLGLGPVPERGEGPDKAVPLGRVSLVRRPSQVQARSDELGPEAPALAPDSQGWSAEGSGAPADATPVPRSPVFGEGSIDLASSSSRTESADSSSAPADSSEALSGQSENGEVTPSRPDSVVASSTPPEHSNGSSAMPGNPDGSTAVLGSTDRSPATPLGSDGSAGTDITDAAVEPPGSVVSDPFDVAAGAIAPLEPPSVSKSAGREPPTVATTPSEAGKPVAGATPSDAAAAPGGSPAGSGGTAGGTDPATTKARATPSSPDSPAASQPLPAAAAAAAVFSIAASGGEPADGILEAEFGTGVIADFDTSDLTPLPNPVPLGDERSNPRIKSSRGAEVAMVSGEVAAQPRPSPDPDGSDIVPISSRPGDRQSGGRSGRAATARPVVSPVGSAGSSGGSGNGTLRSVELDQELSAAAEVVELVPPRPAIAVPLPASAEGPAGKLGRARRSPDRTAEVGPAADEEIDTLRVRRPSTRVSAMLRAASGHSLARTVTATIGAAVLVGACFGLLFWWFGARNEPSSADGEAGAQVAGGQAGADTEAPGAPASSSPAAGDEAHRTPIASGAGDFANAAAATPSAPSATPRPPSVAPPPPPQPSAAATSGSSAPPSAALPVAAGSQSYDDLYEEAKRARRKRDYHAVLAIAGRALAHRETAQALTLQAEAMTALGDSRRALTIAARATELRPRFSSAWYVKGRIHRTLGENDQARAAFERYLELDPEGTRADQVIDLLQDM